MKRIGASLGALAALACVLLAVALAAPRVLGHTPFVVLSGSMEPTYPVGSLVYVRSVDASELRVGDPVTFTLEGREAVATHRVIEVDAESASLRTQGDANDEPDGSPVQFASVIGSPAFCVPLVGYAVSWVSRPPGLFVVAAAIACLFVWALVSSRPFGRKARSARDVA